MQIEIRQYRTHDAAAAAAIWNEVVRGGVAFPQREELTEDGGFLYNVICARFGNAVPLSAGEQYVPPCLLRGGSPLLPRYLGRIENALRLTAEGISHAAAQEDRAKLTYYQTALREVRAFRAAIDDPKKEEHYADGSDRI